MAEVQKLNMDVVDVSGTAVSPPASPTTSVGSLASDGSAGLVVADCGIRDRAVQFDLDFSEDEGNCEAIEKYFIGGGFHPIHLGDRLGDDGRFKVVHKLGQGGFGTVWLCRDTEKNKWRAVKVNMAGHSSDEHSPELKAMRLFGREGEDELVRGRVSVPLETFWIDGPSGRHLALVMELLGPSLKTLPRYFACNAELIKDVAYQLVEALEFIHARRLCHGDLTSRNVCFRLRDTDFLSENDMLRLFGAPQFLQVHSDQAELPAHAPKYLVRSAHISCASGLVTRDIAVLDFGVCYPAASDTPKCTGIDFGHASPEELLMMGKLGYAADIWALGATLLEMRRDITPFNEDDVVYAITEMEDFLGPLPEPFRAHFIEQYDANTEEARTDLSLPVSTTAAWIRKERELRVEDGDSADLILCKLGGTVNLLGDSYLHDDTYARQADTLPGNCSCSNEQAPLRQCSSIPDTLPGNCTFSDEEEAPLRQYSIPEDEMKELHDLLSKILVYEPKQRMALARIKQHAWFGKRYQEKEGKAVEGSSQPSKKRTRSRANRRRGRTTQGSGGEPVQGGS